MEVTPCKKLISCGVAAISVLPILNVLEIVTLPVKFGLEIVGASDSVVAVEALPSKSATNIPFVPVNDSLVLVASFNNVNLLRDLS